MPSSAAIAAAAAIAAVAAVTRMMMTTLIQCLCSPIATLLRNQILAAAAAAAVRPAVRVVVNPDLAVGARRARSRPGRKKFVHFVDACISAWTATPFHPR